MASGDAGGGRYARNMPALSPDECASLRRKRVCVVGCGGLGGYVIELLARAGIGALNVVDGDVFEASNLNRQLLSDTLSIGESKAAAAARRVALVNPDVDVSVFAELFTFENSSRLLEGCDLAIDALDNIDSRFVLAEACTKAGIFLVHGAISGFFAQVTVIAPGDDTFNKLYPSRAARPPLRGNLGFVASMCASAQAAEAVKLLCGRPPALLGKLLLMDLNTFEFTDIKF